VDDVPKPRIIEPTDVILKVTLTAICGSDLHLYGGLLPTVEKGDIFGHEFMGTIVEVGNEVKHFAVGDRVVVPFTISCGTCYYCANEEYSLCDNSNPCRHISEETMGYGVGGLFGFTKLCGDYAGGQAEYVRVPFADVGCFMVPRTLSDEQVLFLTDIFPTGWMAAENCDIRKGDTVAIWGAGPVGQFALRSALMQGAGQVIVIDHVPERLKMAAAGGARTINYDEVDSILDELKNMTEGRGPDCAIEAVGMEASGGHQGFIGKVLDVVDRAKQFLMLESDRPAAIREVLRCVRKGGRVSIPGVYSGIVDNFPLGFAFNKGLTLKMGQTHVQKFLPMLLQKIEDGSIDPSFIITHRLSLEDAPRAYEIFRNKEEGCIKVVLKPEHK